MAEKNPKFDIDMTGLNNLFDGVVAFVEVRSGYHDISNEIAREMREIGATLSVKRHNKVTHVIYGEGTLRTSNWAKKHNVPLVGVGWVAACMRSKMKLLCTPWLVPYTEEPVDVLGLKKRVKYKKYCKWMNQEEFEEEANRSAERAKKRLNKSLNKSQINDSFGPENDAKYERVMKLSDPCLRPRPPTPEFLKKHKKRHERIRLGGRYSWESSDEDKETASPEYSGNSTEDSLVINENIMLDPVLTDESELQSRSNDEKPFLKGARRLFKDTNSVVDTLIEPVRKINKKVVKKCIPKVVFNDVEKPDTTAKKRKLLTMTEDCYSPKRNKIEEVPLNISESTPLKKETIDISILFNTPPPKQTAPKRNTPLSPLITSKATVTSTPQRAFLTPVNKRNSLRTRVLKKSARKLLKETLYDQEFSTPEMVMPDVLVPDTKPLNIKKRLQFTGTVTLSPSDLRVIPETPTPCAGNQSLIENTNDCSMISSLTGAMFDTPNASRILNEIIPNRVKSQTNDHILFVQKERHNHYSSAITPNFKQQIKYITDNFPRKSVKKIDEIMNKSPDVITEPKKIKPNVRRSIRLSKCNEALDSDFLDIFRPREEKGKEEVVTSVLTTGGENEDVDIDVFNGDGEKENKDVVKFKDDTSQLETIKTQTKPRTRRSLIGISATPLVTPTSHSKVNLKRAWADANPDTVIKKTIKPVKDRLKENKFRDSRDDFDFTPKTNKKTITRKSMSVNNEIVIVGMDQDELVSVRGCVSKMPRKYSCVDIIRSKEQLIVVAPDKCNKNIELFKAFVLGNTFVCLRWLLDSIAHKTWLDTAPYKVMYTDIVNKPCRDLPQSSRIFAEYAAMYISPSVNCVPKYKLRLLIEQSGGTVTDSFRQAGIVIDTRKVNALSVTSAWILDCVKAGHVIEADKYRIT